MLFYCQKNDFKKVFRFAQDDTDSTCLEREAKDLPRYLLKLKARKGLN